jgi:ribosomal protein L34E
MGAAFSTATRPRDRHTPEQARLPGCQILGCTSRHSPHAATATAAGRPLGFVSTSRPAEHSNGSTTWTARAATAVREDRC